MIYFVFFSLVLVHWSIIFLQKFLLSHSFILWSNNFTRVESYRGIVEKKEMLTRISIFIFDESPKRLQLLSDGLQ